MSTDKSIFKSALMLIALAAGPAPAQGQLAPDAVADDPQLAVARGFLADMASYLERGEEVGVGPLRERFGPAMAAELGEPQVRLGLMQIGGEGPVRWELVDRRTVPPDPEQGGEGEATEAFAAVLERGDAHWVVRLRVDPEGRLVGWRNSIGAPRRSRAELITALAELSGDWGFAAELYGPDGTLEERVSLSRGRRVFPLGSIFKLYVLAELARQVTDGELDLEQPVALRTELKSLPSGILQDRASGETATVREMAELMIAISDNTATDHLIELVGRRRIEEHLAEYGNSVPELNRPFLKTREMFIFKGAGSSRREAVLGTKSFKEAVGLWLEADRDQRLAWLEGLEGELAEYDEIKLRTRLVQGYAMTSLGPQHAEVEWFARPGDLLELLRAAQEGRLVNPETSELFLEFYGHGTRHFPEVGALAGEVRGQGYKGGSETGIYALSSRVVLEDGRVVLACLLRSRFSPLDAQAPVQTSTLFNAWIRHLFEEAPGPG